MNNFFSFFKDSWSELKQVSWLTVPQMVASTVLVMILVGVMAVFLFILDKVFQTLIGMFI